MILLLLTLLGTAPVNASFFGRGHQNKPVQRAPPAQAPPAQVPVYQAPQVPVNQIPANVQPTFPTAPQQPMVPQQPVMPAQPQIPVQQPMIQQPMAPQQPVMQPQIPVQQAPVYQQAPVFQPQQPQALQQAPVYQQPVMQPQQPPAPVYQQPVMQPLQPQAPVQPQAMQQAPVYQQPVMQPLQPQAPVQPQAMQQRPVYQPPPTPVQRPAPYHPQSPVYVPTPEQMQQASNQANYANPNMVPRETEQEDDGEALEEIAELVEDQVAEELDLMEGVAEEQLGKVQDQEDRLKEEEESLLEKGELLNEMIEKEQEKVLELDNIEEELAADVDEEHDELTFLTEGAAEILEIAAEAVIEIEEEADEAEEREADMDAANCPEERPTSSSLCEDENLHALMCPYDECMDACGEVKHKTIFICKHHEASGKHEWHWLKDLMRACSETAEMLGCPDVDDEGSEGFWNDEEDRPRCECPDGYVGKLTEWDECDCGQFGSGPSNPWDKHETTKDELYHHLINGPKPGHKTPAKAKLGANTDDSEKGGLNNGFYVLFIGCGVTVLGLGYCCYAKTKSDKYEKMDDLQDGIMTTGGFTSLETPHGEAETAAVMQEEPHEDRSLQDL